MRERYDWPVTIAHGGDPWIKADAVMPAVHRSSADVMIVADADCWTPGLKDSLAALEDGAPWAIPHTPLWRLDDEGSRRFMAGEDHEAQPLAQPPYIGYAGGGIVVAPRETLLDVPLDPRFVGWGHEDSSWFFALRTLAGRPWRGKAPMVHIWHPPQQRTSRKYGNWPSVEHERRYRAAYMKPNQMRQLIEEIEDGRWQSHNAELHDPAALIR